MGFATYNFERHPKPAWIAGYSNLSHCSNCGAVFNNQTEFVRGYNVAQGTMPSQFVKTSNCKKGCCPVCDTPISK